MSSDLRKNPNRCSFPFDHLPDEIQSRILSLLPITTLVLCKAVSRSWRSLISSPVFVSSYRPSRDPIFLFYGRGRRTNTSHAYLPSTDRWVQFHFPQHVSTIATVPTIATAGTSLLLADMFQRYYTVNPFSLLHPIHFLPPVPHLHRWYKVLALIERSPSDYIIVVVTPTLHTHTYDSQSGCWEDRGHLRPGWRSLDLGNAVYLDGLLFCLSHQPNRLLTFDPIGGQWSKLNLDLPVHPFRSHLLGFQGELYLTGFLQDDTVITRIAIWKLDRSATAWKEFALMPDKYLAEFSESGLNFLSLLDCRGLTCFSSLDLKKIVLCDLEVRRWWCPQPCNIPGERGCSFGCAIEPPINLLK